MKINATDIFPIHHYTYHFTPSPSESPSEVLDIRACGQAELHSCETYNIKPLHPRLKCDQEPQDNRSRLTRHLFIHGFTIKNVPGDNNCQFHALADQLDQVAY